MVTEIVHGLDLAFRQNVVRNFRARYCDYLRRRLQETAECPQGWNNNQDFRNTVIQAVQAETRQQATGIIQEDQTIAQGIRQAVIDFVQRMHTKYHNNLDGFGHNICTQELINEATVPEQWPANRDRLVRYLFQQIWNIPLYSGEDNRDMDEQADNQQAQQDIEQLPQGIQNAITNFINGERNLQVTNIPVNQYDIRACLGIDPPAPPQVIEQPTAIGLGIARPGNGNGNGDHNGGPGDNANYVGNADEDEFEEDDLEEEYYGRPLKGAASPLVPLMIHMLEHCNGYLTFPLVPHQPWGPIAIPFDHAFTQKAIFQGIKHLVNPQISDMQRRIIEAIQNGNMENADMLEQELDAMEAEINAFHRLTSTKNRFNQLFDIRRCATMINDQKQVTERGYRRWLDSDITWTKAGKKLKAKRFTPRPFFLTDGIRLYTIHVDWLRGKREGVQAKFMTELRRTTREAMIPILGPDNEGLRQGVNLSNHYRGVVGMDFGEVCAVASVYRPTNSTLQGSQLVIKRGFLYGRAFLNRDKYNKMKATNGIDHLLTELGASTYQGTYQQLVQFLDLIKANTRAYRLWMFQSKACVMRFKWDNSMSMRSRLDQACYLVTNQASATDIVPDERPLVFGFGLDGISQQSRRGAVTPMDQKLINALFRKIKQANRGRQVNARDICTRVDEYMTSQTCCRCIKNAEISQAEYHVRQATINDRMTQNAQGQVQLFRVVRCAQHPDQHTYHRDGNAAENMATILRYMIRFQRRPNRFIRQSRVLAAEQ
ncbi:predicted protein [Lichtheimia corymbifera JMRC:FSU:9682]|uniref:Uncharacterized protein n=1 Tax=Lichtheimia corymbifera JMRC:FSU:9682 TaxID=1263082 RepID=A0A068RJP5_9FUNG|nr:predicted protein [Lichtheimia corymbifera JMRC:FSU:9682]